MIPCRCFRTNEHTVTSSFVSTLHSSRNVLLPHVCRNHSPLAEKFDDWKPCNNLSHLLWRHFHGRCRILRLLRVSNTFYFVVLFFPLPGRLDSFVCAFYIQLSSRYTATRIALVSLTHTRICCTFICIDNPEGFMNLVIRSPINPILPYFALL